MAESLKKGYATVYDQCSQEVKDKLEATDNWESIQRDQSLHDLVNKIERICVGFDNHKQEVFNLIQALKTLFLYSQSNKETVEQYSWNFRMLWETVEAFRGSLGIHQGMIEAMLKDPTRMANVGKPTVAEINTAEDDAMERCRLQSCAAAGELKLTQLRQASLDLRRTAADSSNALKRSEYMYLQTLHEDASERRRIRKELVFYGIAPVHASDPPMSPLHHAQSSASQFSGVGVSKNAFRTSAANRSRSGASRASGAAAASALSRGNARYMNNGFSAAPVQSSSVLDTSSPARGASGRGGVGLTVPAAPTRSSRYNHTSLVTPVVPLVVAPVSTADSRRRNGRSVAAPAPEAEAPRAEESAAAKRRAKR